MSVLIVSQRLERLEFFFHFFYSYIYYLHLYKRRRMNNAQYAEIHFKCWKRYIVKRDFHHCINSPSEIRKAWVIFIWTSCVVKYIVCIYISKDVWIMLSLPDYIFIIEDDHNLMTEFITILTVTQRLERLQLLYVYFFNLYIFYLQL